MRDFGIIESAAKSLGSANVLDLAKRHPDMTLHEFARMLSNVIKQDLPPVAVDLAIQNACTSQEDIQFYVKSSLVRRLRESLMNGWSSQPGYNSDLARALAAWSSRLPESIAQECRKVFGFFVNLKAPEGWLPIDHEDPIIDRAFDQTMFNYPISLKR